MIDAYTLAELRAIHHMLVADQYESANEAGITALISLIKNTNPTPELWMVSQVKSEDGRVSEFQGVFSTENEAVAACRDWTYTVQPVTMGESLPHETCEPNPRGYYPIGRPQGAKGSVGLLMVTDDVASISTHDGGQVMLHLGASGSRLFSSAFITKGGLAGGVTFSVGDPRHEPDAQIFLDILSANPEHLRALGEMFIRAAAELEQPT